VANNAGREGTLVVNTSNLWLDAALMVYVQTGATSPIGDSFILLSTSIDGTKISTPATGADAALTPANLSMLGAEQMGQPHLGTALTFFSKFNMGGTAVTTQVTQNFGSIAAALGGNLFMQWSIVFVNMSGQSLGTTAGNHIVWYDGVYATSVAYLIAALLCGFALLHAVSGLLI
jgi:hypothetical protein